MTLPFFRVGDSLMPQTWDNSPPSRLAKQGSTGPPGTRQPVTTKVFTGTSAMPDWLLGRGSGWAKPFRSTARTLSS